MNWSRSVVMNGGVLWWIGWCDELRVMWRMWWIEEWCDELRWIEEWCDKLWCDEEWCAELRSDVTNWGVAWWIEGKGGMIIKEGANWWPRECNRATQNRQTRNRTKIGYRELATVGSMHTYTHSKVIMNKLRHAKNTHRQFHSKSSGQEISMFFAISHQEWLVSNSSGSPHISTPTSTSTA